VRATLHDELMREAGFESDYYAELARRREVRRERPAAVRFLLSYWDRIIGALCACAALADRRVDFMSDRAAVGVTILAVALGIAGTAREDARGHRGGLIMKGLRRLFGRVRRISEAGE